MQIYIKKLKIRESGSWFHHQEDGAELKSQRMEGWPYSLEMGKAWMKVLEGSMQRILR